MFSKKESSEVQKNEVPNPFSTINMEDVVFFEHRMGKSNEFITWQKAVKGFYFGCKIIKNLQLREDGWDAVLLGYDKRTGVVVLKKVSPDEYGARKICFNSDKGASVYADDIFKALPTLTNEKNFEFERNKDLIYLSPCR